MFGPRTKQFCETSWIRTATFLEKKLRDRTPKRKAFFGPFKIIFNEFVKIGLSVSKTKVFFIFQKDKSSDGGNYFQSNRSIQGFSLSSDIF
jgi:hypothetical protein